MTLTTSSNLLMRLRDPTDAAAWERVNALYSPLLLAWLRRYTLNPQDADDLVQEVLATLVRELPGFRYDRQKGAFRGWLRSILVNRLREFWRVQQHLPRATGDSGFLRFIMTQLEDPNTELSQLWDREHDQYVVRRLLELVRKEFEETTWEAFRLTMLEEEDTAVVAEKLKISRNAVYLAKSRVLHRLRQEAEGLID